MTFDEYLAEYYGFTTQDSLWKRMGNVGKNMLRTTYKSDIAKLEKDIPPSPQVAALPSLEKQ